jgi:hypothetical protein
MCRKLIIALRNATKEVAQLNYFTADFLGKSSISIIYTLGKSGFCLRPTAKLSAEGLESTF